MPIVHTPQVLVCYCATTDIAPPAEAEIAALLDLEEQERYQRMRPPVALRFFQGRRMVRQLLAQKLHCDAQTLRFTYSENGKPGLACESPWRFSISHCDTAVVVAIGTVELGVDVEAIHRQRGKLAPPWRKPQNFMHAYNAKQVERCGSDGEKARLFTVFWTMMESQVKLADSSIFRASKHLAITLQPQGGNSWATVTEQAREYAGGDCYWWSYEGLDKAGGDIVSLALRERGAKVELLQWSKAGAVLPAPLLAIVSPPIKN